MKHLIRIKRPGVRGYDFFIEGLRREPQALIGRPFDLEHDRYEDGCDFFLVESNESDKFVELMAQKFPGCDIEMYAMAKVGHCPAGEFAMKRVTEDGILPA